ncbi:MULTISPECIES: hypothetical protein [Rhodanobacter]|uniref:Uncharacterized protein n=1 Tax=Rhodanobacter denitrificans TaxID=666685 RepID=M4NKS7_9GAMM|nr:MULTISPECIES: hypothetical protein [Rhodanobacter]AGG88371.1 hypothetical protein R2APBS1_1217 [Rhodanobacter denitrificans]KZC19308.1 hypothetical protein RHOFW104R3_31800 [Rhodanobacter denitrificans]UJJ52269.1 hypothetical protein LRK52_06145 [Rhodanobacter denitrificans]UJM87511.1 hypothetical protein LRJ86_04160 [Rhodanobacter denitrificans]UJM95016.1 hypothetical protein LRK32_06145 [Rhodanobacter denitrificans]
MSLLRSTTLAIAFATVLLAGGARAADVSMADGSVHFSTPDNWLGIMETQGDPEARVFQVPDPSPTGKNSLARVTVTVKQVADVNGFNQYRSEATAKAMALPGYKAAAVPPGPNSNVYSAQENGTAFSYTEHYWFKSGHAIQLRCVRPSQTQAGADWKAAFDKGCDAIAAQLK